MGPLRPRRKEESSCPSLTKRSTMRLWWLSVPARSTKRVKSFHAASKSATKSCCRNSAAPKSKSILASTCTSSERPTCSPSGKAEGDGFKCECPLPVVFFSLCVKEKKEKNSTIFDE